MADRLLETFAEVLRVPVEELDDATSPETTPQWDSLKALELVAALEDEFEVELTAGEIVEMRSIGAARATLKTKGVADV